MMKLNSKKTSAAIISVAVLSGTFAPFSLFAQEPAATVPPTEKGFCAKLPDFSSKTMERLTERTMKYDVKKAEGTKKIADNRQQFPNISPRNQEFFFQGDNSAIPL